MNIFIDSNILFEDYFFENKSNAKLLDYCKRDLLVMYMSEIVLQELRRQYHSELKLKIKEIEKLKKESKRLKIQVEYQEIVIEDNLKHFDEFYQELEHLDSFVVLKYKNEFLPNIVDRAIHRKMPFTEKKSELKDAVIWLTYANFVESNDTKDCVLLTNNTSDFCTKSVKSKVHPDLEKDSERFLVVNSSWDFIKTYSPTLESAEHQFLTYIGHISFNKEYVTELLDDNFLDAIKELVHSKVDRISLSEVLPYDYIVDAQFIGYDVSILELQSFETEVVYDKLLVSGALLVNCETEILEYNPVRDTGEDPFSVVAEKDMQFRLHFNFDFKEGETVENLEVTDVEFQSID